MWRAWVIGAVVLLAGCQSTHEQLLAQNGVYAQMWNSQLNNEV